MLAFGHVTLENTDGNNIFVFSASVARVWRYINSIIIIIIIIFGHQLTFTDT